MRFFLKNLYDLVRWSKRLFINLWEETIIIKRFFLYEIKPGKMRKYAYLRACCHVIDKGLEADNWEPGHGSFIYNTAIKLRKDLAGEYTEDRAYLWINSVISEYEKAQNEKRVVKGERVKSSNDIIFSTEELLTFNKILKARTSCRNYIDKKIDIKVLVSLVESAIEAPVGCCRQTVRFFITQNKQDIDFISKHVSGMTCFSNIPCIAVVYVHSASYVMEDRRMQYVDASLAIENFVLAATANNLASTICNFTSSSTKDKKAVAEKLGASHELSPVVVISVGYPARIPRKPLRMDLTEFYNYRE